jgi:alpha-D-ribose 1-methylphosphonate 5-triphosphate synthase subunit PhnG
MFQTVDTAEFDPNRMRARWIAQIARAPIEVLESALAAHLSAPLHWLRRPETGLMMVQGRVAGSAERFNLGELSVTRCTLRTTPAEGLTARVGVAYVLGRSHRRAHLAAPGRRAAPFR